MILIHYLNLFSDDKRRYASGMNIERPKRWNAFPVSTYNKILICFFFLIFFFLISLDEWAKPVDDKANIFSNAMNAMI